MITVANVKRETDTVAALKRRLAKLQADYDALFDRYEKLAATAIGPAAGTKR